MESFYRAKETRLRETAEIYQEQLKNALEDNVRLREQHISSTEFERRLKYYEEQNIALSLAKNRFDLAETRLHDENMKLKISESCLRSEVQELNKKLEELPKNTTTQPISSIRSKYQSEGNEGSEYYLNIVEEIEKEYDEKYNKLRDLVGTMEKENFNLKTELDNLKKDHAEKIAEIEKLQEEARNTHSQEDSYENALAEETEMMKAAFQVKIKKLQDELATLKKKHSEDVIELKLKLQKEQETKDLLLKKLQIQAKV